MKVASQYFKFFFKESLNQLGECINKYRKQKLVMAPGSEPDAVRELMQIIGPYVYGKNKITFI